jgi:hypothetical protein
MNARISRRGLLVVVVGVVAVVLSACGAFAPREQATSEPLGTAPADSTGGGVTGALGGVTGTPGDGSSAVAVEPESPPSVEESAGAAGREGDRADYAAPGAESGELSPPAQPTAVPYADQNPAVPPDQQFTPALQAGEIDDNEDFAAYLQYRLDFNRFSGIFVHDVDVSERHLIRVTGRSGGPVLGATVMVYAGQYFVTGLRTTAAGTAYFFPRAYPYVEVGSYEVVVEKGQDRASFTLTRESTDAVWDVALSSPQAGSPVQLDVLFLLDATGSMQEEIRQLQDNILSISAQIEALPGSPDVRFGLVHYRDRGDMYETQTVDFTGSVRDFQRELDRVSADGGGDTPESMNAALHQAVNGVSWRVDDTVSIIILVADAPPHLDYYQDFDYAVEMQNAASLGIKIFPIAVQLDEWTGDRGYYEPQAEYVFRQLAQFTGGHLILLLSEETPQSGGEPGTSYSVPEDRYTVEDLDALVVRLIREELDALGVGQ